MSNTATLNETKNVGLKGVSLFDNKIRNPLNVFALITQLTSGLIAGITGIIAPQITNTLTAIQGIPLVSVSITITISFISLFFIGLIISGFLSSLFLKFFGGVNTVRTAILLNITGTLLLFIFGIIAFAGAGPSLGINGAYSLFGIGQFILGFGAGILVSALTYTLVENNKKKNLVGKYLNLSNSMYGIGIAFSAFVGPAIAAVSLGIGNETFAQQTAQLASTSWQWYYLGVAIVSIVMLIIFFVFPIHEKWKIHNEMSKNKHLHFENHLIAKKLTKGDIKKGRKSLVYVLLLFVLATASFIFIENTVTATWASGMQEVLNNQGAGTGFGGGLLGVGRGKFFTAQLTGVVIGFFWTFETLGRIIYSFFSHKFSELKIIAICGIFVTLSAGLFLINYNLATSELAIAIIFAAALGLFGGPIFPAILTSASKTTKNPNITKVIPGLMLSSGFITGILITLTSLAKISPAEIGGGTGFLGFTAAIVALGVLMSLTVGGIFLIRKKLGKSEALGS